MTMTDGQVQELNTQSGGTNIIKPSVDALKSGTDVRFAQAIAKDALKASTSPLDILMNFLDLETLIKEEYEKAMALERQKFIKFFFYALLFMFLSMIAALWGLGFVDYMFYVKFILGIMCSLGLAFITGRVKDYIKVQVMDKNYLKSLMEQIVKKLST
jgi:hypothetical protein